MLNTSQFSFTHFCLALHGIGPVISSPGLQFLCLHFVFSLWQAGCLKSSLVTKLLSRLCCSTYKSEREWKQDRAAVAEVRGGRAAVRGKHRAKL